MSSRLATRLGLPAPEDRLPGAMDLVRFHEPATGSLARTKGSLFLLAQMTGGDAHLAARRRRRARAARARLLLRPVGRLAGRAGQGAGQRQPAPLPPARPAGHPTPRRREHHRHGHPRPRGACRQARARRRPSSSARGACTSCRRRRRSTRRTRGSASAAWRPRWARRSRSALHLEGRAGARRPAGAGQPQPGPGGRRRRAQARPGHACVRRPRWSTSSACSRSAAAPARTGSWPSRSSSCRPPPRRASSNRCGRRSRWPACRTRARCRWPMPIGRFLHRMGDAIDGLQAAPGHGDPVRLQRPVRLRPAPPAAVPAPDPAHRGRGGGTPPAAGDAGHGRRGAAAGVRHQRGQPAGGVADRGHPARRRGAAGDRGDARPDGPGRREGRRPRPGRPRAGGRPPSC